MQILVEKSIRVKAIWFEPAQKYAVWDWLTQSYLGLHTKKEIIEIK